MNRSWKSLFLVMLGVLLPMVGCGGDRAPAATEVDPANCQRDITALELMSGRPPACERNAECPDGSRCEDGECRWDCLSDTDCGLDQRCSCRGTCEAAAPSGIARSRQASTIAEEGCTRDPDALAELDQSCYAAPCICGSFCDQEVRYCVFECIEDEDCGTGNVCNYEGKCTAASAPAPVPAVLTMEADPLGYRLRPTRGAALAPMPVQVTLSTPQTPPASARVRVVPLLIGGTDGAPAATVRCGETGAFAESCTLEGPWSFSGGAIKTATATVELQFPPVDEDQVWSIELRSNEAINPVITASVELLPKDPVPVDGYYTGTATPEGGHAGEAYPLRAVYRNDTLALVDDGQILTAEPTLVLSPPYLPRAVRWVSADSSNNAHHALANLAPSVPDVDEDSAEITGTLTVTTSEGATLTWSYRLARAAEPTPFATCTSSATCTGETTCATAVGRCLPRVDATSASSRFVAAARRGWSEAAASMLPSYLARLSGIRAVERTVCHDPQKPGDYLGTGFIEVGIGEERGDVGELACANGGSSQAFPFLAVERPFEMNGSGGDAFNLLAACIAELSAAPQANAATFQQASCLSPARFFHALAEAAATEDELGDNFLGYLTRNWLKAHALIAQLGALDYEHARTLATSQQQLATPAPEALLDVLERGWDLLLDADTQERLLEATPQALATPDYRGYRAPLVYWSFNFDVPGPTNPPSAPDVVNGHDLHIAGNHKVFATTSQRMLWIYRSAGTEPPTTCRTNPHEDLVLEGDYTIFADVFTVVSDVGNQVLFRKMDNSFAVWADYKHQTDTVTIQFRKNNVIQSTYTIPPTAGIYAFVHRNGQFRFYGPPLNWGHDMVELASVRTSGPKIPMGTHTTGRFEINCNHRGFIVDDFMVFERALAPAELSQIASTRSRAEDTPFPLAPLTDSQNPAFSHGVPLYIAQTANRHLNLLAHWMADQTALAYDACYLGQSSAVHQQALRRAGRTLRRITSAEALADQLLEGVDAEALPWIDEYRALRQATGGARSRIAFLAQQLQACENPLGIAEADLPMFYRGAAGDPVTAFFGSSRYLLAEAEKHTLLASNRLAEARDAWLAQRASSHQAKLSNAQKLLRQGEIRAQFEAGLQELCGAPTGSSSTTPILDGALGANGIDYDFLGACFIDTTQCSATGSLQNMPPQCLRGRIGEQALALQGALITAESAQRALDRAILQHEELNERCAKKDDRYADDLAALEEYLGKIKGWRRAKAVVDGVAAAARAVNGCNVKDTVLSFGASCGASIVEAAANVASIAFQEKMASIEDDYRQAVEQRSKEEQIIDCFFEADQYKHVIDAQFDSLREASHSILGVKLQLDNMTRQLGFLAEQAQAALAAEDQLFVASPQHHYWFDDKVRSYLWSFSWAKRLTYLAMRSAEYERQSSLGLRSTILAAQSPHTLEQVQALLLGLTVPGVQDNSSGVDYFPLVVSVRKQILRIARQVDPDSGQTVRTDVEAFQDYLKSNAVIVYSNGKRYGRGIRFSLRPSSFTANSCAQRIWRVSASIQMDEVPQLGQDFLLFQTNTFGSTFCDGARAGELQIARTRPGKNLLLPRDDGTLRFVPLEGAPKVSTSINLEPFFNMPRLDLQQFPVDVGNSSLAGRGLFADYILVFPDNALREDFDFTKMKDILLRFQLIGGAQNPDIDF